MFAGHPRGGIFSGALLWPRDRHPTLRQALSGHPAPGARRPSARDEDAEENTAEPDHGGGQHGLPGPRKSGGGEYGRQRHHASVAWAFVLFVLLVSIEDAPPVHPQRQYEHARQLFFQGYLEQSQQEADKGYRQYRISEPQWASKFRL